MDEIDPRIAHAAALAARRAITVQPEAIALERVPVEPWARSRAAIVQCARCGLRQRVGHTVPHDNPSGARFLVLGEAPGESEDEHRAPFVGSSGRYLRAAMTKVGFDLRGVAFGNVVGCWPHDDDRSPVTPTKSQQKACQTHMGRWVDGANAVLLVGGTAKDAWRSDVTVEGCRGEVGLWTRPEIGGRHGEVTRLVMVVRHPSSILRAKNKTVLKAEMRDDLMRWGMALACLGDGAILRELMGTRCVECMSPAVGYVDPDGLGWCARHAFMDGERGKKAESAGLLRWEKARTVWDKVKVNDHPQLGFGA